MAINSFFQDGEGPGSISEQNLVESNIIELIQMAGQNFYYIKRTEGNIDEILNEDPNASFDGKTLIEMYPSNATDYGGQGHLLGKFGLEITDTIDLVVSKKRLYEELDFSELEVPNEGDLIFWPMMRSLWEIKFIEDEATPFYTLSGLYTYTFKCARYVEDRQEFDTGIPAIDNDVGSPSAINPFQKNDIINDAANNYQDFAEGNPFGEISEDDSENP